MDRSLVMFFGRLLSVIHRIIEYVGRWIFLLAACLTGRPEVAPPIDDDDLILGQSLSALATMIRLKKISSEAVVKAYIERIEQIQPVLNCMSENRFAEALEEAKTCDRTLNSSSPPDPEYLATKLPFFGVPFTLKDCIGVKGMKQTAGLVSRRETCATKDAEVVQLLRKAGAIPLATTNVSELAMWWETTNCLYGTTRNPYNTWHIVGGSSGGEGCLQAAAGSSFGVGSDIGGSIRMPCFFNGIFGHKPSQGTVSNDGQYPSANTEEQNRLLAIGPMCRFATDLKPVLRVMLGENAAKLNLDAPVDISKLKVYHMEDDGGQFLVSPVAGDIRKALSRAVYSLSCRGARVRKVKIRKLRRTLDLWFACMTSPKGEGFAFELGNRQKSISVGWELLKWLFCASSHTLIALLTAAFEILGAQHRGERRARLISEGRDLCQEFQEMLGDDGVFLYPTHPTPAPMHHEPLIKPFNFSYTAIVNCLGLPATACPLGLSHGLPIGIQVLGGMNQDHLTLAVAEELERCFGGWQRPGTDLPRTAISDAKEE